ncbi:MAG: VWA domain-containing protein [Ruminococcaceae bacterium]|nr:VWA domain-containing protein [Oscillospiraceae bacterium]
MKGLRAHWMATLLSFCGAVLGAVLMNDEIWEVDRSIHIIWVGLVFAAIFLLAFAGMAIGLRFFGKYRGILPADWKRWFLVALLGLLLVGVIGEALWPQEKNENITNIQTKPMDLVLLVDCSGSMDNGRLDAAKDASCQLVDILNEQVNLQVISFGGTIVGLTGFEAMDASGRTQAKDFIRNIDCVGATNFDEPLQEAKNTLDSYGRGSCKQAVLLVTDGECSVDTQIFQDYQASSIEVHSVRITDSYSSIRDAQDLISLANATGGSDTDIDATYGSVDASELLDSFRNALQDVIVEEEIGDLRTFFDDPEGGVLLRILVVALCYVLSSVGFYGKPTQKGLIIRGIIGLLVSLPAIFMDQYVGFMVWYLIAVGPALVLVRPEAEVEMHV